MKAIRLGLPVLLLVAALGLGGCPRPPAPLELIVDNQDAAVTIVAGDWELADTTDGNGSYGPDFLYHFAQRDPLGIVRYTLNITQAGQYTVYIWWSAGDNRTMDQPVIVHDANGDTTYHVDLQQNGNQWYRLGVHEFAADAAGYVEFNTDTDDGYCNADAVRLVEVQ